MSTYIYIYSYMKNFLQDLILTVLSEVTLTLLCNVLLKTLNNFCMKHFFRSNASRYINQIDKFSNMCLNFIMQL